MESNLIKLWRDKPPTIPLSNKKNAFPIERIFPSGRQALSHCLFKIGLSRANRVALPEWSSHCVISAIGKFATPIPVNEVIKYNIKVDAILLYEQWGWPFQFEFKAQVLERFKECFIILDRVDSADIDNSNRIKFYPETTQIDIISLSKLLGLFGGGLAKINGEFVNFKLDQIDFKISEGLWKTQIAQENRIKFTRIHMNEFETILPELKDWLSKNDLYKALKIEYKDRQRNLRILSNSNLSNNWPDWMFKAIKDGAGPSIAPIFRNMPINDLRRICEYLLNSERIETSIYHFNWSGNQIEPLYENVLAFPINGMINENIEYVIDELNKLYK